MDIRSISTSMTPRVEIEVARGNLQAKGWDRAEVTLRAEADSYTITEDEQTIRIRCQSDCSLRLPETASLAIENAYGSVRIKLVQDAVKIGVVRGGLEIRNTGQVQVDEVYGNLIGKLVEGNLLAGRVRGNTLIQGIEGDCTIERINGNADIRDVEGIIRGNANGNARLRLRVLSGDIDFRANGNIQCRIPEDASAQLNLESNSETIHIRIPEHKQVVHQRNYQLALGQVENKIDLYADGAIYIQSQEPYEAQEEMEADFATGFTGLPEDFGQQIAEQVESQIEAQMELMTHQLNEQMERLAASIERADFSREESERILEQARVSSERAAAMAQERMRRAQEKLERKLEAARRRSELRKEKPQRGRPSISLNWSASTSPKPEPPTEEERLLILRMLEQKKITIEEADQLLAALEGQSG